MKHQSINIIVFIALATKAAALFIQKPHFIMTSTLLDTSDRRRQVAQPTLPSNYWWPYASLTWGGSTATATVPATTVMPSTVVASVSSPTVSSDSTSTPTSDISSSTISTSSSSSISDFSTTSIDPQQTNATSHAHISRLSVPIIASIAGGVVGLGLLILLLYRCRREHTTRRTSRRRRDIADVEKGWRHVSIDNNQQQPRSWWNTMFSTHGEKVEDVIPGPRYVGVDDNVERSLILGPDDVRVAGQLHDELLLAEKPRRSIRRSDHTLSSQPLISSRSISTTGLCALAELDSEQIEDDDSHCDIPWESLRHKSIKRAILAKVDEENKWTDSMRGVRAAIANAAKVGRRQTHVRNDSDFWVERGGGGFRIVAEPPPQIPTPPSKTWTSLASSFPFLSSEEEDRYTPAPTRMRSNSKSQSWRGSVTSPVRVLEKKTNQDFLRSPPTVMSPEMESALCFTPVLSTEYVENDDVHDHRVRDSGLTSVRPGQERMQGQQWSRDTGAPGTAFTKTYRLRTDRALKRVEAIVESGWTERGVATRIVKDAAV